MSKGQSLASYELEPLLMTGLSEDANRTKRRLVTYDEIPPNLVQAVLAIEDRKFFEHGGVNYLSMVGWAWHDIIGDRKHRGGASTLTMQLAKLLFVADTGTIKYKVTQILMAFHLEHRFTKKQIFEAYANQINLGQRGSFSIQGFGEASQVYFGKDVRQLDLAECAMLAGIIQRPNYFNPFRHPERTIERRNLVLDSMVETGAINKTRPRGPKLIRCIWFPEAWTPARLLISLTLFAISSYRSSESVISIERVCASTRRSTRICSASQLQRSMRLSTSWTPQSTENMPATASSASSTCTHR